MQPWGPVKTFRSPSVCYAVHSSLTTPSIIIAVILLWPAMRRYEKRPFVGAQEITSLTSPEPLLIPRVPTASKDQRRRPTNGRANNDDILYAGAMHQGNHASASYGGCQANRRFHWASLAEASQIQQPQCRHWQPLEIPVPWTKPSLELIFPPSGFPLACNVSVTGSPRSLSIILAACGSPCANMKLALGRNEQSTTDASVAKTRLLFCAFGRSPSSDTLHGHV